jgi:hypothetical protein
MKHNFILFGICLVCMFSCKKDKKDPPAEKLYDLSFNVTGFSQTYVPIEGGVVKNKTTTAVDTLPVTDLIFILFSADGKQVKDLKRVTKNTSGFGQFKTGIGPGNYVAAFCAGSSALSTSSNFITSYTINGKFRSWGDTFHKRIPITVSSSPVTENIELDRLTAQFVLNIIDPIPSDVTKVTVSFPDRPGIVPFTGELGSASPYYISTNTATFTAGDAGKANYRIVMNTLNNVTPFTVTIQYFKTDQVKAFATKIIKNIVCNRNVRTILSGNVFTPGNAGFTLSADSAYNAPITTEF